MAEADPVVRQMPMPAKLMLDPASGMPAYSPAELAMIEDWTGQSFDAMERGSQKMQVMAWLTLRRLGFEPSWEEAGAVLIEHPAPDPPAPAS